MAQARPPYSCLSLAAGGGPKVSSLAKAGPEKMLTLQSFKVEQVFSKTEVLSRSFCTKSVSIALQAAG